MVLEQAILPALHGGKMYVQVLSTHGILLETRTVHLSLRRRRRHRIHWKRGSTMLWLSERKKYIEQYPLLGTIGNTPLIQVDILRQECPQVEVRAKLE
jgi:hypothetical protein